MAVSQIGWTHPEAGRANIAQATPQVDEQKRYALEMTRNIWILPTTQLGKKARILPQGNRSSKSTSFYPIEGKTQIWSESANEIRITPVSQAKDKESVKPNTRKCEILKTLPPSQLVEANLRDTLKKETAAQQCRPLNDIKQLGSSSPSSAAAPNSFSASETKDYMSLKKLKPMGKMCSSPAEEALKMKMNITLARKCKSPNELLSSNQVNYMEDDSLSRNVLSESYKKRRINL